MVCSCHVLVCGSILCAAGGSMRRWFGALVGLLVLAGVLAVATAGSAVADAERGAVADLVVAASVPGVLAVSWTPPTNPAGAVPTDYRVRWAAVGDPYLTWSDLSGNAFPNAVSFDIGDLTVGVAYRVQVRARYRSGRFESAAWSGPVGRVRPRHRHRHLHPRSGAGRVDGSRGGPPKAAVPWPATPYGEAAPA